MTRLIYILTLLLTLFSCASETAETPPLSESDRQKIEALASELEQSLNQYDHKVLQGTWESNLMKKQFKGLSGDEKSILLHFFENDFPTTIINWNAAMIQRIQSDSSLVASRKVQHFDHHSELTYTLLSEQYQTVDFLRYRIEMSEGAPKICDTYLFKDAAWLSEKLRQTLRVNARYTASSPERRATNRAIAKSGEYLANGNTLEALQALYDIPDEFMTDNTMSIHKLRLAIQVSDSIYIAALQREFEDYPSFYIRYLYHSHFQDSLEFNQVLDTLSAMLDNADVLDSLRTEAYFWE